MRKKGAQFVDTVGHTVDKATNELLDLATTTDSFLEGPGGMDEIGPEEGYKAALIQFQLDQVKLTKEYQKVIGEKDAELARLRATFEEETGKTFEGGAPAHGTEVDEAAVDASLAGIGGGGMNPMAAFAGMSADQLRAQVEVLLDSVTSWEARVADLVESKADYAAQVAHMRLQVERSDMRMGDLVDRVKLQQSELEKYILMADEGRMRTVKDRETIDGLVKDYTALVTESQAQEAKHVQAIEDLENKKNELQVKLKAYERNIIQLIDTQAELGRQQEHQTAAADAKPGSTAVSAAESTATAAAVEALQKDLQAKEEEIKRLMASSVPPMPASSAQADMDALLARAEAAELEVARLTKEVERTKKSLDQAVKAGEKLGKDYALLRGQREEEQQAEAALREEVMELQAKLEAAYKGSKAELALAQDRLVKLEGNLVREVEGARAQAREEAQHAYQKLVEVANQEKQQALELYAQENRKRKAVHNKLLELQGNIRVLCRVRPILAVETASGEARDVTEIPSPEDLIITRDDRNGKSKVAFEFDRVFAPAATQAEIFEAVAPVVTSVLDGYSACIFAYGQTGSGKTHTMEGPPEDRGVNFRALEEVFRLRTERQGDVKYTFSMSCLEIYNETVRDLLGVKPGKGQDVPKLDIRLLEDGSYDVPGLTLVEVESLAEVIKHMTAGKQNRAVGAHDMNEHSSRSHAILSLRVRGENLHDKSLATVSKLHLIDLAGSERLSKTDATGERLKEAQNINKSLSALGDVINALGTKAKGSHIPYRNSKLTFLLQDSLGGNSKVLMFCNISPASYNVSETVCSLNFAFRCRSVSLGVAKQNVVRGGSDNGDEVARLQEQVEKLSLELDKAKTSGGGAGSPPSSKAATSPPKATAGTVRPSPSKPAATGFTR